MDDNWTGLVVLIGGVCVIYYIAYRLLGRPYQTKLDGVKRAMTAPAREAYVKIAISDAVTEAVETLLDQDVLTREEAMTWYRRISNAGLPDLLPKGQLLMKAALKAKHPEFKPKESNKTNVIPMKKKVGEFLKR